MAHFHSPRIVTEGLVHLLETTYFNGTTSHQFGDRVSNSNWSLFNFTNGNSANLLTLNSNVIANGSGNSHIILSRNSNLETGSITFQFWINLKNIPIDVGTNNNWRAILPSAADPLRCVLEQDLGLNWTTTHTDGVQRRHLNGNFKPVFLDAIGWQFITYMYNQSSGQATIYKNNNLVVSGPMSVDGVNPTTTGLALRYTNYISNGFRIFGGTNSSINPAGEGCVPGEFGNIHIYNRALTPQEVLQNYNATKGRYGL